MSEVLRILSDEDLSEVLGLLSEKNNTTDWMIRYSDNVWYEETSYLDRVPCRFVFGDIEVRIDVHDLKIPTINGEDIKYFDLPSRLQYLMRTKFIEEGRVITW